MGELFTDNLSTDAVAHNWDFGDNFTDTTFEPYHGMSQAMALIRSSLKPSQLMDVEIHSMQALNSPPFVP